MLWEFIEGMIVILVSGAGVRCILDVVFSRCKDALILFICVDDYSFKPTTRDGFQCDTLLGIPNL